MNTIFCSEKGLTDKKIGIADELGKQGEEFSSDILGNLLHQNISGDNKQSTPSKGNILVVDDTPANLNLLIKMLSEQGYKVRPVPSGKLALRSVQSTLPDLILLDIRMPQMDGYEVCSKLKASSRTKDVPVIFISALDEVFDKVKAFSLGGVDYITKPFQIQEVLARIENQLTISRLSKQLNEQNIRLSQEIEERKLAEEALHQSVATHSALLNAIPDLMFRCHVDGTYIDFKPAKDFKTFVPPSEFIGKNVQEILPPELAQRLLEAYQQAIRSGETQIIEYQLPIDNQLHDYEARIVTCGRDEIIAIVRDITERKQVEVALAQSERKYRNLVETSFDVIWSTDTQGHLTFVNQAVKEVFGYEPEEMLTRPFADFTPPEQLAKDLEVFQRILNGEALRQYETIRLTKDYKPIHLLLNAIALLDEQGQVIGTTGTALDITDRKLAEAEILRTKDLFESIFNESTDAIFLVNPETGLTLDCNRRAVELCQVTSKNELLNTQDNILQKEPFTPEELRSILDEIAHNGFWSRELEYVTKKGTLFWGDIAAKPIHIAGQKMNLVRVTDITERKIAEEALRQSEGRFREQAQELELALNELKCTQSQLIQAEKMLSLGQMVAGVAHEINNPVTFIYGNLTPAREYFHDLSHLIAIYQQTYPNSTPEIRQIVEDIDLDFLMEDWQQLINSMQVGAERIRQVVRSLLLFSRQNTSQKKPVDIHKGIDNTLLLLQHRLRAESTNVAGRDSILRPEIKVIKDYGQLPKVTCYGGQLNQVFMNLLCNAIDALETQPSPRVITIRTEMGSRESEVANEEKISPTFDSQLTKTPVSTPSVVIRITDNGPGMSEAVQKKIFDPFFTTKSVGSGMGLGLSISYQIVVEKHDGKISCLSTPGKGTELIVEIPVGCKAQ